MLSIPDPLDGLSDFHQLVDLDGLPAFRWLVTKDIEFCHQQALVDNSFPTFMETLSIKPTTLTDTNLLAALLEHEHEKGLRWAA